MILLDGSKGLSVRVVDDPVKSKVGEAGSGGRFSTRLLGLLGAKPRRVSRSTDSPGWSRIWVTTGSSVAPVPLQMYTDRSEGVLVDAELRQASMSSTDGSRPPAGLWACCRGWCKGTRHGPQDNWDHMVGRTYRYAERGDRGMRARAARQRSSLPRFSPPARRQRRLGGGALLVLMNIPELCPGER